MARTCALLRGINVGGNHKLPMKELAALFEQAGCREVETYIQSGNVVFRPAKEDLKKLGAKLEAAIEARFGFPAPVALYAGEEVAALEQANPFLAEGCAEDTLHVGFLRDAPRSGAAVDASKLGDERAVLVGRALFLHLPKGVGRSKLTSALLDKGMGTIVTLRNLRTVRELARRAAG